MLIWASAGESAEDSSGSCSGEGGVGVGCGSRIDPSKVQGTGEDGSGDSDGGGDDLGDASVTVKVGSDGIAGGLLNSIDMAGSVDADCGESIAAVLVSGSVNGKGVTRGASTSGMVMGPGSAWSSSIDVDGTASVLIVAVADPVSGESSRS
jgi:hypothetical protein